MDNRFQEALQAHRIARDAAERAAEAKLGRPLNRLQRRLARRRAKVDPRHQLLPFDCPLCLGRFFHWGDQAPPEICKNCRKWV